MVESVVEDAALDWLGGLGYEIVSGLAIAPGEPATERADYKQVFLFDRLQTKLEDSNPIYAVFGFRVTDRDRRSQVVTFAFICNGIFSFQLPCFSDRL